MNDRRIEIQGGGDGTGFKLSVYFDRLPQMALPKYRKLLHLYFTALSVYPQPDTLRQWLEEAFTAAKWAYAEAYNAASRKRDQVAAQTDYLSRGMIWQPDGSIGRIASKEQLKEARARLQAEKKAMGGLTRAEKAGKQLALLWQKRYTLYLEIERKYTHV